VGGLEVEGGLDGDLGYESALMVEEPFWEGFLEVAADEGALEVFCNGDGRRSSQQNLVHTDSGFDNAFGREGPNNAKI